MHKRSGQRPAWPAETATAFQTNAPAGKQPEEKRPGRDYNPAPSVRASHARGRSPGRTLPPAPSAHHQYAAPGDTAAAWKTIPAAGWPGGSRPDSIPGGQ